MAPLPARIVEKGLASDRVVVDTVIGKYADHLPLYRQAAILEREAGLVNKEIHHFKRPVERPFTKDQRGRTTLLFGGLTWKHEKLVHGALERSA